MQLAEMLAQGNGNMEEKVYKWLESSKSMA